MAFSSFIQFGNNDIAKYSRQYQLKYVNCHFKRDTANGLRPTTDAVCESVNMGVIVPGKDDRFLFDWYISGEPQTGRIIMEVSDPLKDNEEVYKEILFEDGMCFSMGEEYELDNTRRTLKLGFMAAAITISDIKF